MSTKSQFLVLFAASLAVRLAAWFASPGTAPPFDPLYQGDAPYWQQAAAGTGALEAWLPFRPPAMGWLVRTLWNGDPRDALPVRLVLCAISALVPPLLYRAACTLTTERIARLAGWICVFATALVTLGNGVHGELPYLALFLLTLPDCARLRRGAAAVVAVRWSLLHAAACLFRADHLLCWALSLPCWLLARRPARARDFALAVTAFALALLPWQLHAAATVAACNERGVGPVADAPPPGSLPWDQDAVAAVRAMPAFARMATFGFVGDTVRARGGTRVAPADLQVLDEAYGSRPEPLTTPLLALYGPLNFFLANSPESDGGFTRAPLDRRPPLVGGPTRYPPGLLDVLPRDGTLELAYPPHLHAINHGYRLGWQWICADPGAALGLFADKLAQTWRGAATGLTAWNLPMGRSGVREPVDLVVADGGLAAGWRLLLFALAVAGWWRLRAHAGTAAWHTWLATRLVTAVLFFGYARLGALCVPVLAIGWAAAIDAALASWPQRRSWVGWLLLGALALSEGIAASAAHTPTIDGVPFSDATPSPHHRVRVAY